MSDGHWIQAVFVAALIVVGAACGGCQSGPPLAEQTDQVQSNGSPSEQEPVASVEGITLFGEVDGQEAVPFVARPARSLQQHTFATEGRDFDPDISRSGELMVFASTRHSVKPDIYLKMVGGSTVTQLTADPASDVQPRFSPDGGKIAFASDRSGNWGIWVMDIDSRHLTQVTTARAQEVHPSWSPDGTRLVYCSLPDAGRQWELWVVALSAPGTKKFVGYGLFPDWSPVGEKILFQRARQRGSHWFSLWTVDLVDGEARYPTEIASSAAYALVLPSWSSDGLRVAYCALKPSQADPTDQETSLSDLWMVDADGQARVQLSDGRAANYSPTWGPDGRVYFTSTREGSETVWSLLPLQGPSVARTAPTVQVGMRSR